MEFGASGRQVVLRGVGAGGSLARVADSSDPPGPLLELCSDPSSPVWLRYMVALPSGAAMLLPPPLIRRGGKAAGPRRPGTNTEGKAPFLHPDLPNWPRRGAPGSPIPPTQPRVPTLEEQGVRMPQA